MMFSNEKITDSSTCDVSTIYNIIMPTHYKHLHIHKIHIHKKYKEYNVPEYLHSYNILYYKVYTSHTDKQ